MVIALPQALPVHLDRRETKDPGDEEDRRDEHETEEIKALWDRLEWAESKASWDLWVRRVMLDSRDQKETYNCSAVNILGQARALVQLIVNGKTFMK